MKTFEASTEDYRRALISASSRITLAQQEILAAFLSAPGYTLSAGDIAHSLGLPSHARVNLEFGRLGHLLAEAMNHNPERRRGSGPYRWWSVLADGRHSEGRRTFLWTLKAPLLQALESAGFSFSRQSSSIAEEFGSLTSDDSALPEEIDDLPLVEGAGRRVLINAYERNPEARRICISALGVNCSICDFNFEATYGEVAQGLIHVHHLRPLAEIASEYTVNPVTDLIPVCPNCHAVLHRRTPAFTPEEIRSILKGKGIKASQEAPNPGHQADG